MGALSKMSVLSRMCMDDTVIWGNKTMTLPERYDFFNKGKNKDKLLQAINKSLV
jgi:hypothetical protein